jgi:23S rRNA (cytidine1920-2'-O)/16S rRNA (cytidine1409-2'-O)-methyltransferase
LLARQAQLICLIKPQFEAGRKAVVKGIVRDELIHAEVCETISESLKSLGWTITGLIESPIMGGDGNREFLMAASRT